MILLSLLIVAASLVQATGAAARSGLGPETSVHNAYLKDSEFAELALRQGLIPYFADSPVAGARVYVSHGIDHEPPLFVDTSVKRALVDVKAIVAPALDARCYTIEFILAQSRLDVFPTGSSLFSGRKTLTRRYRAMLSAQIIDPQGVLIDHRWIEVAEEAQIAARVSKRLETPESLRRSEGEERRGWLEWLAAVLTLGGVLALAL